MSGIAVRLDAQYRRRLDVLDAELSELRHLLRLLAAATDVDLDHAALVERAERRPWLTTWQEIAAVGLDPLTGMPADAS